MRALFSGVIAIILLGVYVHLVRVGYRIVDCGGGAECVGKMPADFNDVMAQTLTVIGALVSALIVAELAITKPGEKPMARSVGADAASPRPSLLKVITAIYIIVWLITGLAAFLKGMYHPKILPPFTSVGQSWLGLAVAAAYAYFGIKP
jgi:energy-converting hydrogenase Eha subunit A